MIPFGEHSDFFHASIPNNLFEARELSGLYSAMSYLYMIQKPPWSSNKNVNASS